MAGRGAKQIVQEIINFYKINREGYPYELIYKLVELYNTLEDVYSASTMAELQEIIDNIGDGAGTIFLAAGTYIVSTTIDIDSGGSLVIYGHGDNTILQPTAGITVFNITDTESTVIQLLKLDLNNYIANTQGILVNETNNNTVLVENVTIDGAGVNGIGIEVLSDNCVIDHCRITDMNYGVNIDGDSNIIVNNTMNTNIIGIRLTANSNTNYIYENILGNTTQWSDNGTNNQVEYICYSAQDIQDAIDSIAAKAGTIHIVSETITVSTTIDIDGGGDYIIEGEGRGSVLSFADDAINISSCRSCTLRNFKMSTTTMTVSTKYFISVSHVDAENVIIENISFTGRVNYGRGVHIINSSNIIIRDCYFYQVRYPIWTEGGSSYIKILDNYILNAGAYGETRIRGTGNIFSGNIVINSRAGILAYACVNSQIVSNFVSTNSWYGICLSSSNDVFVSGNTVIDGDIGSATSYGAIYAVNSDRNIITNNTINNNNNTGAGDKYGVYIVNAASENNVVKDNTFSGNDVNWKDDGTNTEIEYICRTAQDIQDAVDSIAAKSGVIHIVTGTISISTTININGGGDYIIEGEGRSTILTTVGDIHGFNISSVRSLSIRNFTINISSYTIDKTGIYINEAADNTIIIKNMFIVGDSIVVGEGIELRSSNVSITDCEFSNIAYSILGHAGADNVIISHNYFHTVTDSMNLNDMANVVISSNVTDSMTYGLYIGGMDYIVISNNTFINGDYTGIDLDNCNYCTITGNICGDNTSNTAQTTGGIILRANSTYNNITGNMLRNNTNTGAGVGYGIYISVVGDSNNIIKNNTYLGNDIAWKDNGTNTQMEYICTTAQDIQDAIDSIAAKSGVIHIVSGTITLNATINILGSGDYIVEGEGVGSIIDVGANRTAFNITNVKSCTLKNFKIDAIALTVLGTEVIIIDEVANNSVFIEKLTIAGDGNMGQGIEINSNYCTVKDCYITDVRYGITVLSDYNIISGNICYSNNEIGILLSSANNNTITGNTCNSQDYGIKVSGSANNTITGNNANSNSLVGIYAYNNSNNNTITGNACVSNNIGISLSSVNNSTIIGNTCNNQDNYGMVLVSCVKNTISGNTVNANTVHGIYLIELSNYNTITGNVCCDNNTNHGFDGAGIWLAVTNDNNTIIGNICTGNINAGAGAGYGIVIDNANCNDNIVGVNSLNGNDFDYLDNGTDTILLGDNTAYGAGWQNDLGTATKNALWNKIETLGGGSMFELVTYVGDGAIDHDIATTVNTPKWCMFERGAAFIYHVSDTGRYHRNDTLETGAGHVTLTANNIRLEVADAPLNANGIAYRVSVWGI